MSRRTQFGAFILASISWLLLPVPGAAQWVILHGTNAATTRYIPEEAAQKLTELAKQGTPPRAIAFTTVNGFAILGTQNVYFARNTPDAAFKALGDLVKKDTELKALAFTARGGWVILHGRNGYLADNIPKDAFQKLGDLAKDGAELKSVAFTAANGWCILSDRSGVTAGNIPDDAFAKLTELSRQGAELKSISFTPDDGWAILFNKNSVASHNIPDDATRTLTTLARQGATLKSLTFSRTRVFPLAKDDASTRAELLRRMAKYKVPGLGIALVNHGKVEWARGYGVRRAGEDQAVTEHTRFQAASISKPVTALAALRLVQQGQLDLDEDLNAKLISWKVPDNEFTQKKHPTLRQLLSHSAGFTVHGFPGYEARAPRPTLLQILNGQPPANTPAIRVAPVPGTNFQYSGGGYTVLQQLLTDVTGKPFPDLLREQVLDPLGMKESTFAQPLLKEWEPLAAVAHGQNGRPLAGNWHVYPERAAAGLWTTPADLARFVMALSHTQPSGSAILSAPLARALFTPQLGQAGLGIFIVGKGRSLQFNHGGSNAGFRCFLVGYPATGQGAVLMTNSDNGDALITELIGSLQVEYGWPG